MTGTGAGSQAGMTEHDTTFERSPDDERPTGDAGTTERTQAQRGPVEGSQLEPGTDDDVEMGT